MIQPQIKHIWDLVLHPKRQLERFNGAFDIRIWDTVPSRERAKVWTPIKKPEPTGVPGTR